MTFGPSRDELYHHRHVFEVIDRPRRIVMTSTETRLDGSSFEATLEFTFGARDGATLMTMVQAGFPSRELREEHEAGLPNAFARLERALARICRAPLEDEIPALKREPGKDIAVFGGARIAHSLIAHRLIDEFRLTIHPVALGRGLGLMHGLAEPQRFAPVSSTAYSDGSVTQVFTPA